MIIDRDPSEKIKIGLAVGAIAAIIIAAIFAKLLRKAARDEHLDSHLKDTSIICIGKIKLNALMAFNSVLLIFVLFATVNYTSFGDYVVSSSYNSSDFLQNYIGAKYFDELGYDFLSSALVIADDEGNRFCRGKVSGYLAVEGDYYKNMPLSHALEIRDNVKARFTDSRWKQFVHDVSYLETADKNLSCGGWRRLLREAKIERTPSWIIIASPIANAIQVERIKNAAYLDLLFIIAMMAAIAWAFSTQTMIFAWLFLALSFALRINPIIGAFLGYDWLVALVIGISMIKKEKSLWAGFFLGYATLINYACGLWLFGLVAKIVHNLIFKRNISIVQRIKQLSPNYYKILMGIAVACGLLLGSFVLKFGVDAYADSFKAEPAELQISTRDVGLAIAAVYRGETDEPSLTKEKKQMLSYSSGSIRIFGIAAVLLLGLFLAHVKDYYAVGLGILPYFWLFPAPFDFYVCLAAAVVIHAADLSKARNVFGLMLIFFIELFANACQQLDPEYPYFLISVMSVLLAIYAFGLLVFLGHEWRQKEKQKNSAKAIETAGA